MFSFHKPKIYRSNNGCCICKAKSSSSRFTDSKKYETEFERCFLIKEIRTGEICNACVLLVKRCKKLPKESCKHWAHVVDARQQGHKSNTKAKSLSQNNNATNIVSSSLTNRSTNRSSSKQSTSIHDENKKTDRKICKKILFKNQQQIANENESNNVSMDNDEIIIQTTSTTIEEECDCSNCIYNRDLDELERAQSSSNSIRRLKKTLTPKKLCTESTSNSSSGNSSENDEDEDYLSDEKTNADKIITRSSQMHSYASVDPQTRNRLQGDQLNKATSTKTKNKRKLTIRHIQRNESSTFLDMTYWKRETVCCGVIFRNKTNDMVLIDSKLFTPCACRRKKLEEQKNMMEIESSSDKESIQESIQDQDRSTDNNNNLITSISHLNQSTSSGSIIDDETSEKISVNLDDLNSSVDNQFTDSINNPINELVVVNLNSSSGISSDSSDISSITEEDEEEEDSTNLISDHNLIAKNMISSTPNRTFGVL